VTELPVIVTPIIVTVPVTVTNHETATVTAIQETIVETSSCWCGWIIWGIGLILLIIIACFIYWNRHRRPY
jgi:apolipoprotein N-acyltransferase